MHGSGAQDLKRVVVRQLAGTHQDALGAVHLFAFFKAAGHIGQGLPQGVLLFEPRLGQVDEGTQALGAIAVDHINMHAGFGSPGNALGVHITGEHQDWTRRGLTYRPRRLEQCIARPGIFTNHHIGRMAHCLRQQLRQGVDHRQHRNASGFQVGRQRRGSPRSIQKHQRGRHINQQFRRVDRQRHEQFKGQAPEQGRSYGTSFAYR